MRERNAVSDKVATPALHGALFEGSSAAGEVLDGISNSGMEPTSYVAQFFQQVGASPKMSGSIELTHHFFTVWLLTCVDRVDLRRSAAGEHICRRILQQQAAIRRDPKSPNYEGLEPYMAHAADTSGVVRAPKFEKFVAERNRDTSTVLKQMRLAKEETEARGKDKGNKNKGTKDKDDKDDS